MASSITRIASVGLVGESVFLGVPSLHIGEETVTASSMFEEPGGKGFNQALAAARAGAQVSFLGAVGSDSYSDIVESFCRKEQIKAFLPKKDQHTSYAVIQTDKDGKNHVTVYRGAALDKSDVDEFKSEIAEADILLLNNEVPDKVNLACADIAIRNRTRIIMNPAPRRQIPEALKSQVFLFTPNEYEVAEIPDYRNCIVTLGDKGSLIKSLNALIPAESVVAKDTTGAGDTYTGVLAVMLAEGKPIMEAAKIATKAAAITITKQGVVDAIPYRSSYFA